jgi:hypothetical protein
MSVRKAAAVALALAGISSPAGAQAIEGRVDALVVGPAAAHAGIGVMFRMGTYLRSGLVAAVGASRHGLSARMDFANRFHLDPFREHRWGPYAGGGLTARFDEGRRSRMYLLVLAGVDGPARHGLTTAIEVGLGGGARIGVIVRHATTERR